MLTGYLHCWHRYIGTSKWYQAYVCEAFIGEGRGLTAGNDFPPYVVNVTFVKYFSHLEVGEKRNSMFCYCACYMFFCAQL